MKYFRNWIEEKSYSVRDIMQSIISVFILLIIIAVFILPLLDLFGFDFFGQIHCIEGRCDRSDNSIIALNAGLIIILTLIIVIVAWIQLGSLSRTSKSDFLLRIDERYSSVNSVKARTIIHEFYCDAQTDELHYDIVIEKISNRIKDVEFKKEESKDFIILINFLDFLETISYFCNKKYISDRDVNELLGCSMNYYYKIFKPIIYARRSKYNDPRYYCEIEKFYEKL
jgi:hypothetical protein